MMIIIFKQSKSNGRNDMAWVAVDKSGAECIFDNKPERNNNQWDDIAYSVYGGINYDVNIGIILPKGTIKKLIGRELNWSNEPVELKEE